MPQRLDSRSTYLCVSQKRDALSCTVNKRTAPLFDRSEGTDMADVFKLPVKQRQPRCILLRLDSS